MSAPDPLEVPLDAAVIRRILPHRYPFLLVDRITELEPDRIVGVKNVTRGEPYLAGAQSDRPALPPALLIEAVAQVGAVLILARPENRNKLVFFLGIERVRFRRPAYAGETVVIEARLTRLRGQMGVFEGHASVEGVVIANGAMRFALGPDRAGQA